jgi:hypothetical protein
MFSADMSHKYEPSKLNETVRSRLSEYFLAQEKDFNFIFELQLDDSLKKKNATSIRYKDRSIPKEE